jgi:hypothetical protein
MTQTKQRLSAVDRARRARRCVRTFSAASYAGPPQRRSPKLRGSAAISTPLRPKRELFLACIDEAWQLFHGAAEASMAEDDRVPRPDRRLVHGVEARVRLVDLWIQALTVAPEDR